ncbi:hypothetical protein LA080_015097 [Diaporthe eres]|nr:hypothetical protein LA080_015097 [Diaporthe eres]
MPKRRWVPPRPAHFDLPTSQKVAGFVEAEDAGTGTKFRLAATPKHAAPPQLQMTNSPGRTFPRKNSKRFAERNMSRAFCSLTYYLGEFDGFLGQTEALARTQARLLICRYGPGSEHIFYIAQGKRKSSAEMNSHLNAGTATIEENGYSHRGKRMVHQSIKPTPNSQIHTLHTYIPFIQFAHEQYEQGGREGILCWQVQRLVSKAQKIIWRHFIR